MRPERQLESVMEVVLALKESLEVLLTSFRKLVPLLEREHQLIKSSALSELERVTAEKEAIGSMITVASEELLHKAEAVREFYLAIVGGAAAEKGAGLREAIDWLKAIRNAFDQQGLAAQVLQHVIAKLDETFVELSALKVQAQPRVDMNIYLTRELLRQHRENIRLWQEIQSEASSTYDASGTSRKNESKGVLQVKA